MNTTDVYAVVMTLILAVGSGLLCAALLRKGGGE